MECVFIGDKFYYDSGTIMSSIYRIDKEGYSRTDWGFINIALRNLELVHIRPATTDEMKMFEKQLITYKEKLKNI